MSPNDDQRGDARWSPPLEGRIEAPTTGSTAYGADPSYRHGVHRGVDLAALTGSPVTLLRRAR
jgi:hypothetical protein